MWGARCTMPITMGSSVEAQRGYPAVTGERSARMALMRA